MRFHLVDRIDAWAPWESLTAHKATSRSEAYWRGGVHGPEMPVGLLTESLCQAGNWLLLLSSGYERRGALLKVGSVTAYSRIVPGDELCLRVEMVSLREDSAVLEGSVTVRDRCVLRASSIICTILSGELFDDPENTARMGSRMLGGEVLR